MKICILDPSLYLENIPSPNLGDQIISRAVKRELHGIFGLDASITSIPTHSPPSLNSINHVRNADLCFVGGSNLLWFRPFPAASWKFGIRGLLNYRELILMGVGWGSYAIKPNYYGYILTNLILSKKFKHSVRDGFTESVVDTHFKIENVLNTACPTMWFLEHIQNLDRNHSKGDACIFSLTDYDKNPSNDAQLINILVHHYGSELLFWAQGKGDLEYCRSLGYDGKVIDRSIDGFIALLKQGYRFDYIGTRLHAGVLCLEHNVRTLILAIDNRAKEISNDTGLPTVARDDFNAINNWIESSEIPKIKLPINNINSWRLQFKGLSNA